ncbi:MAG: ROK family transcriptional regulator [Ardenticatenaceae bacterium]|nr:ROK family transcriptional regulator [Ardenticatenaceae bacterium]
MKKATRQQTKDHNTRLVLKTIYDQGEISRADVARATRLTRPTVSTIVAQLMAQQFVIETGQGPSAGGKRPTLLGVAPDNHHLLAADLSSQAFRGAIVNLRGQIQHQLTIPVNHLSGQEALPLVYDLLDQLTAVSPTPLLGIGIGAPGLVDAATGTIRHAVNLEWVDLPLGDLLAARYEPPIYLANDSHMAALAEYTFGAAGSSPHLIVIKVGRGVGAGLVLNGQPFFGDGMSAGEIGHVVVDDGPDGRLCTCGNTGCLETIASAAAMLRQAQETTVQPGLAWPELVSAYLAGDTAVTAIVQRAAQALGQIIAGLIGSLNVRHIILAGSAVDLGAAYRQAVAAAAHQHVMPALAAHAQIDFSTLGRDIVILGCSAMILHEELGII